MRASLGAEAMPLASTSYAPAPPPARAAPARRRGARAAAAAAAAAAPAPAAPAAAPRLGAAARPDFPILAQTVHGGRPLVYLDNAATSQKPRAVLGALSDYYAGYNSNVHRGVHALSARSTAAYEDARGKVAALVGAADAREVVWTRGATEAVNLVAASWGAANIKAGDEIVLSVAEHHSNIVPWQMLAQRTGAVLRFAGLKHLGSAEEIDLDEVRRLVVPGKTKLISLVHVSNALGCVLDAAYVAELARGAGARLLLDCCQSVPNAPVDVSALGADWIVASGHKMCGPTGVGFLWGRLEVLEGMPPWQGGGEMIDEVSLERSTYAAPPSRFEAGTPAIGEAIGLGAAADYLRGLGMGAVAAYERELGGYLYQELAAVDGVRIYGPPPSHRLGRAALASFNVDGVHPSDLAALIDAAGVAVRAGHLCTQPLHAALGAPASLRAAPYLYNTHAEVDTFVDALRDAIAFFKDM